MRDRTARRRLPGVLLQLTLLSATLLAGAACSKSKGTPPERDAGLDARAPDAAGPDAWLADGVGDLPPVDIFTDFPRPKDGGGKAQTITLTSCDGRGPGSEDCHFRLRIDPAQCSATKPCDKLVVYWAGGEGACWLGAYDLQLQLFNDAGYVAACAQPYTTSGESGAHPYYAEFDRMNHILQTLRARADVKAAWTGDKLLLGGVSHGATAPLLAIANKAALKAHAAVWTGKSKTALLLNDGISNSATLEQWASQDLTCLTYHSRWVARYGDGAPLVHLCTNAKCHCSNPAHKAEWDKDNVQLGTAASPYGCSDVTAAAGQTVLYRFVSCSGGAALPCGALGDIIPDAQQSLAFDGIKTCAGVTASYQRYDSCPHVLCGSGPCGGTDSLAWLAQQGF